MIKRFCSLPIVLLALFGCTSIERSFLPNAALADPHWQQAQTSQGTVDHDAWDHFLGRYVAPDDKGVNRVDYAAVTDEDRAALDAYIARLEATEVTALPRAEQFAFWVNLYNAKTVAVVLDHYPVESIRKIDSGFFDPGPWDEERLTVEDRALSLDDIEHRILRPVFADPRVHYVLNCAASGCPNLGREAYRGEDLEERLEAAARAYINSPRGVSVDERGALTVSKIYSWFKEDFGDTDAAVLDHIRRYAETGLRTRLDNRTDIDHYEYDWSLNDVRRRPPP